MKYIKQLLYILAFTLTGEVLQALLPLPVPAAIYGLVLLLIALCTGVVRQEQIADTADFLLGVMPLLFVAPGVQILRHWGLISENLGAILIILVVSTWVVFAVAGTVSQWLLRRKGGKEND